MEKSLIVSKDNQGMRLDKFLALQLPFLSRTNIHNLIEKGCVCVDGGNKKPSFHLQELQKVRIIIEEQPKILEPFAFDIRIIYEDSDLLVVDKPTGLTTHPPQLGYKESVVNALLYMKKELSSISPIRPGVVHRLDKETSGVMVFAKNNLSHLDLIEQFRSRKVKKEYLAIVWGVLEKESLAVDLPLRRDKKNRLKMKISFLESKKAYTEIEVKEKLQDSTFLVLRPLTGRMHQIRVHLEFLGFPIVGDQKYGPKDGYGEMFLHAYRLGFFHPQKKNFVEFISTVPERFKEFISVHRLFGKIKKNV
jgi:23S rRNA pseudouridine1911/1915/1917 synthase